MVVYPSEARIRMYGSTFSFAPEIQAPPWIQTTVGSGPEADAGAKTSIVVSAPPSA